MYTTSGTTKAPKFVLHHQRSIVQHAHDVAQGFGYLGDKTVGLGRCRFVAPMVFRLRWLRSAPGAAGGGIRLSRRAHRDLIARYRVTNTNLTGHMIAQLIATGCDDAAFASIRFCGCGSGCAEVIAPAAARGLRVAGVYGSSEVQALFSHHNALDAPLAERAAGGGWPVSPLAQVRARDVTTGALLLHGESGALRSAHIAVAGLLAMPRQPMRRSLRTAAFAPATSVTLSPMDVSSITRAWAMLYLVRLWSARHNRAPS
jgi:fatty-acyl-CoA synthase